MCRASRRAAEHLLKEASVACKLGLGGLTSTPLSLRYTHTHTQSQTSWSPSPASCSFHKLHNAAAIHLAHEKSLRLRSQSLARQKNTSDLLTFACTRVHLCTRRWEGQRWCAVNGIRIDSAPLSLPTAFISFPLQFAKPVCSPTPDVWLHFPKIPPNIPPPTPVSSLLCMFVISMLVHCFNIHLPHICPVRPQSFILFSFIKPPVTAKSVSDSSA